MARSDQPGLDAGKLRHRVQLQKPTKTTDSFGQPVETWTTVAEMWALVESVNSMEVWQAQQISSEADGQITMRYNAAVTQDKRFLFGGTVLNIFSVNADAFNVGMKVQYKQRVGVTA